MIEKGWAGLDGFWNYAGFHSNVSGLQLPNLPRGVRTDFSSNGGAGPRLSRSVGLNGGNGPHMTMCAKVGPGALPGPVPPRGPRTLILTRIVFSPLSRASIILWRPSTTCTDPFGWICRIGLPPCTAPPARRWANDSGRKPDWLMAPLNPRRINCRTLESRMPRPLTPLRPPEPLAMRGAWHRGSVRHYPREK